MTTPEPENQPSKIIDIVKPLIEGFNKLPPLLSYGGLILIAALVISLTGGGLPNILLAVPVIVIVAYLVDKLGMRWLELQEKKITSQSEETSPPAPPTPEPIEEPPQNGADDVSPQEWERRYLERVAARCELLPMEAIDKKAARPDAAKVALNKVFTQVDVNKPLDEKEARLAANRPREPEERREPAAAAVGRRQNKYLVLLGKPGSGKSTLVDFIALCLAGQILDRPGDPSLADLEEQDWTLGQLLPVRVILREYAEDGLRRQRPLWEYIADGLCRADADGRDLTAYAPHMRQQLKREGGLLLLDGLDEVPDAHRWRERLRREIRDFAAEFGRVRIVVTGRPYAYDKPEWQLPGFTRTELLDFNETQMFAYVDKRYQLMAEGETGLAQTQAAEFAEELKRQIQERPPLRELAARPLLLALITSLHHWRGGRSLPQDREKLYDESVDLLIDLWQQRKRLPEIDP
ncbi:MAG: NACHT domain-containing protein, partial [Anaerolineae bacterium]